jgi:hypothetical protein
MITYEQELINGLRREGKIHCYHDGGTDCGLGKIQFVTLNGSHFHAKEEDNVTCVACKNVSNDHNSECGWAEDRDNCFCKLKFPVELCWEIYDSIPAGSVCEGRDQYNSFKDVISHVHSNIEYFTKKGHNDVIMKFEVEGKILSVSEELD